MRRASPKDSILRVVLRLLDRTLIETFAERLTRAWKVHANNATLASTDHARFSATNSPFHGSATAWRSLRGSHVDSRAEVASDSSFLMNSEIMMVDRAALAYRNLVQLLCRLPFHSETESRLPKVAKISSSIPRWPRPTHRGLSRSAIDGPRESLRHCSSS